MVKCGGTERPGRCKNKEHMQLLALPSENIIPSVVMLVNPIHLRPENTVSIAAARMHKTYGDTSSVKLPLHYQAHIDVRTVRANDTDTTPLQKVLETQTQHAVRHCLLGKAGMKSKHPPSLDLPNDPQGKSPDNDHDTRMDLHSFLRGDPGAMAIPVSRSGHFTEVSRVYLAPI